MILEQPLCGVIDEKITRMKELNGLCFLNNIFKTGGSTDIRDKTSAFGSLLWNIPPATKPKDKTKEDIYLKILELEFKSRCNLK
jgi:hypothetical protein